MTLQEYIIRIIRLQLDNNNIPNWLGIAPRSQTFPFVNFNIIATKRYDYSFSKDKYQDALAQFNIYTKGGGLQDALDYSELIDNIFENITPYVSIDNYNINDCQQVNAIGPRYIGDNDYWETILQYKFVCSKTY